MSAAAARKSRPALVRRATAIATLALVCVPVVTLSSATASSAAPRGGGYQPPPPTAPTRVAPTCGGETATTSGGRQMTCTFDDEFSAATGDASALDGSKWLPLETSASGLTSGPTNAAACYVNSGNNISVANGTLNLTARKEAAPFTCTDPYGNFSTSYTSGQVTSYTKFSQAYGQFEVRAKLPTTTAKGLQETFWLYPATSKYGAWPTSGEIDFSEFYSGWSSLDIPYLHYNYDAATTSSATNTNVVTAYNCPINYGDFNTYSATWTPGTIAIQVNGTTCLTDNYKASGLTSPAPFDQPFFLTLTQALGIGDNAFDPATTPLPATTQVDYVRVWS